MAWHVKNQIPIDVWKAFYNLRNEANFAIIVKWLRGGLHEEDVANRVQQNSVLLHQGQGRAQSLDVILCTNDSAESVLRESMNPQNAR